MQGMKVPALFLVGENEKIYSAQKAIQRLNKVAPHIETDIIPEAGHDLTIVQAEEVNRKVLEFLRCPTHSPSSAAAFSPLILCLNPGEISTASRASSVSWKPKRGLSEANNTLCSASNLE